MPSGAPDAEEHADLAAAAGGSLSGGDTLQRLHRRLLMSVHDLRTTVTLWPGVRRKVITYAEKTDSHSIGRTWPQRFVVWACGTGAC